MEYRTNRTIDTDHQTLAEWVCHWLKRPDFRIELAITQWADGSHSITATTVDVAAPSTFFADEFFPLGAS